MHELSKLLIARADGYSNSDIIRSLNTGFSNDMNMKLLHYFFNPANNFKVEDNGDRYCKERLFSLFEITPQDIENAEKIEKRQLEELASGRITKEEFEKYYKFEDNERFKEVEEHERVLDEIQAKFQNLTCDKYTEIHFRHFGKWEEIYFCFEIFSTELCYADDIVFLTEQTKDKSDQDLIALTEVIVGKLLGINVRKHNINRREEFVYITFNPRHEM